MEAFLVEQWSLVEEIASTWENSSDQRRTLSTIDSTFRSNNRLPELQDPDSLMLWSKVKYLLGGPDGEVLNILNQTISMHPTFYFSLADKALLLASVNDWDQALDSAQRVMDADADNLDGLQVSKFVLILSFMNADALFYCRLSSCMPLPKNPNLMMQFRSWRISIVPSRVANHLLSLSLSTLLQSSQKYAQDNHVHYKFALVY